MPTSNHIQNLKSSYEWVMPSQQLIFEFPYINLATVKSLLRLSYKKPYTNRSHYAHPAGAQGLGRAEVFGPPEGFDGAGAGVFDPVVPALSLFVKPSLACIMGSCTSYRFQDSNRVKEFDVQGGMDTKRNRNIFMAL